MKRITEAVLAATLSLFILSAPVQSATEHLSLTVKGDVMAPAICDGDTVRVKICTDGALIKVGPVNRTDPGDIIVYCAGAAVAQPQHMWMCGRAVSKHFEDGHWYIKTQLDSSPEPDPWSVPEYFLLGVIVEVIHAGNAQNKQLSDMNSTGELPKIFEFSLCLAMGICIGLMLGLSPRASLKHENIPRWISLEKLHT
jgi:hypothetical protein